MNNFESIRTKNLKKMQDVLSSKEITEPQNEIIAPDLKSAFTDILSDVSVMRETLMADLNMCDKFFNPESDSSDKDSALAGVVCQNLENILNTMNESIKNILFIQYITK